MTKTLASVVLMLLTVTAYCQQPGKSELEKERAAIQKEIDDVRRSLDETKRNKKTSLAQLNQVQRKLQLRQRQVAVINKQINLIEGDINQSWRDISKLKKELDTLKMQYGQSIVYSYKNRSNYDFLNFIFSAGSFNDALKRVAYLKSYRTYREQQAATITNTQELLQQKISGLNLNREKKTVALKEESKERQQLEEEKKEKDVIVSKLKAREKELNKDLADKRKQDAKVASAIRAAIERETRKAIAEAKKNADAAAKANVVTTAPVTKPSNNNNTESKPAVVRKFSALDADPEARKLSDNFEKNRGSLPWPIESGRISMHFGRQRVEGLDNLQYDNQGLTFETESGKAVKAVFEGEVSSVFSIGSGEAVIIKHGRYFTTYSNLTSVNVNKGQQIKTGQTIGRVAEKEDNLGELEFIISNDANRNFDPEKWLRR
jgi:septal ring factor EnvC (AmiA/AmiB activator)